MSGGVELRFLGGAGTVTGSKTLVTGGNGRVLVDCGLFQGLKKLRLRNWDPPPVPPSAVDTIVLTHAHLDHSGYLPVFVREGFRGRVHCTEPTRDIAGVILRDSARIQEEDAERANRLGYTKHKPARPLYTQQDVDATMDRFEVHDANEEFALENTQLRLKFRPSGHIPGSVLVEFLGSFGSVVFTGDLGRQKPLFLEPPALIRETDVLVLESTYGDRNHSEQKAEDQLVEAVEAAVDSGGPLLIPSFAVERAQELLVLLLRLRAAGRIPHIDMFLDSPMGANVTDLMLRHRRWHTLSEDECRRLGAIEIVRDFKDTLRLRERSEPFIVVAGSGMLTGGRILHYLEAHLGNPNAVILTTGYQAEGTRGRRLANGERELKFFGEVHRVRAQIRSVDSLSAHADQREILEWLGHFEREPGLVLLNHGEEQASAALAAKIHDQLGWNCRVARKDSIEKHPGPV